VAPAVQRTTSVFALLFNPFGSGNPDAVLMKAVVTIRPAPPWN
jgi:hypothetical protein